MVSEGDLLAGKYRVERVLGEGGMGYVVAAMHEQLEQRVAVKLLVPELAEDQDAAARFLREARAAVRIQSEHVARVLDVGESEAGAPYMVMEFLSGRDLARELEARGTFDIGTAIDFVLQACEAVAEAHAIGVIHRDLKPANLFLTRRADGSPLVKVLDFGISKALASSAGPVNASLTAAHSLLGSPAYMSPEQARRPKEVDIRTDIWSLGVILYEFLTGDTPYHGDVPLEVITAALSDPMPSIVAVRSDVPRELEAIVAKCMEKRPVDRYQTVAEFAEALGPFAPHESRRSISRISGIIRSVAPPPPSPARESGSGTLRSAGARTPPELDPVVALDQPVTRKESPGARDTPARDTPGRDTPPGRRTPRGPGTPRGLEPTELAQHDSIAPQARAAKDTQMDWGRSEPASSRSRRRALFVAGAVLAALLVAGWAAMRSSVEGSTRSVATDATTRASLASEPTKKTPAGAAPAIEVMPGAAIEPSQAVESAASATADVAPRTTSSAAALGANGSAAASTPAEAASAKKAPGAKGAAAPTTTSAHAASAKPSATRPAATKNAAQKSRETSATPDAEDPLENRH